MSIFDGVSNFLGLSDPYGDAANAQSASAKQAMAVQKEMYDQSRADLAPWRQAGETALTGMQDKDFQRDFTMADFTKDPGYDFRMAEGQKALERSAAARGGLLGGAQAKALTKYGQDFASNEYQNAYNRFNADRDRRYGRLSTLAGMGENAAGQQAGMAQNYGNSMANLYTGMGNAQAGAIMGNANASAQQLQQGVSLATLAFGGGGGGGGATTAPTGGALVAPQYSVGASNGMYGSDLFTKRYY